MSQIKTDKDLFRSLLNEMDKGINYSNIKGPGDFSPSDDPDVEFSDEFEKVAEKSEELKNRFQKFLAMVDENPKSVYKEYKGMDLETETGYFTDAFPRFLDETWNAMLDESEDFIDNQPKTKSELKTHIQFWAGWFEKLDDLIRKYDEEINDYVTPEQGNDFVEPVDWDR